MSRKLIIEIIAALFILLFFYTSLNKFISIESLKQVLPHYLLIGNFPNFVAWAVPISEIAIVALLFFPATRLPGLYASLIMMVTFTLYIIYMLSNTTDLPCTCGGMLQELSWPQHIAFNVFFIILAIIAIILKRKIQNTNIGPHRLQQIHG